MLELQWGVASGHFNRKLRGECLKLEIFYSLKEAQVIIGAWRDH
jgi:hypothetical protein